MTDEEFEKLQKIYLDECNRRDEIRVKTGQVNQINKKLEVLDEDDYRIYNMQVTFNSSYEYTNDCESHCVPIYDKNLLIKLLYTYRDDLQRKLDELLSTEVSNEQQ